MTQGYRAEFAAYLAREESVFSVTVRGTTLPIGMVTIDCSVSEPRASKNRVHLDLFTDDRAAQVTRLTGLGASALAEHSSAPVLWWTVLTDPEGNEFCVCNRHG